MQKTKGARVLTKEEFVQEINKELKKRQDLLIQQTIAAEEVANQLIAEEAERATAKPPPSRKSKKKKQLKKPKKSFDRQLAPSSIQEDFDPRIAQSRRDYDGLLVKLANIKINELQLGFDDHQVSERAARYCCYNEEDVRESLNHLLEEMIVESNETNESAAEPRGNNDGGSSEDKFQLFLTNCKASGINVA